VQFLKKKKRGERQGLTRAGVILVTVRGRVFVARQCFERAEGASLICTVLFEQRDYWVRQLCTAACCRVDRKDPATVLLNDSESKIQ
jgi:hypothetical protein